MRGKIKMHEENYFIRNTIYNKGVAIECGVIAASIFSSILSYVKANEISGRGQMAYASSPILEKLYPEFTATQIRQALMTLKKKLYIDIKNKNEDVNNDFDYVITLKEKGITIYSNKFNQRFISPLYKMSYKKRSI